MLFGAALLLLAGLATVAWVGADAVRARDELRSAAVQIDALRDQVQRGDLQRAAPTLTALKHHAAAAFDLTHGPRWSAVAALPWLGRSVRAVQTVSEVADGLATGALPALVGTAAHVDPAALVPRNGRVDLAPLREGGPAVIAADVQVQDAVRRVDSVDRDGLLPAVSSPLSVLRSQLDSLALTTATAARAVRLLPPMLGADGPRSYLVLVQNNAEQRATGGVPTLVRLRVVAGQVEIAETRSATGRLAHLPRPILPLTPAEQSLFGEGLGTYLGNVTSTPDFPRSAKLARAIWRQRAGTDLDGVLSIDPGGLANLLAVTGPVKLTTGGVLTAGNAAGMLMNAVYLKLLDPAEQDRFFAATAVTVFSALSDGRGNPSELIAALGKSAREGRLMVWSAHQDEQALLSGTMLSGELVGVHGHAPVVGVFLNDGTAAKIGYYLRTDVVARPTGCRPDGSQTVHVTVTLTNTLRPADVASLPPYISSGILVPKGQVRTNVLLYAPAAGQVERVTVRGASEGVLSQTHDGLAVVGKTVQLKPAASVAIDYDIVTGHDQPDTPVLRVTPVALGSVEVDSSMCARLP
ncbi:MAG TPA: DUF4012 domain-containing protein [Dermatophilaceae bacterium]|nr:DUF4012 domain-containing protein [Dermatophilaceae bacterium]